MPAKLLHRDDLDPGEIAELESLIGPFVCGGDVEEQLPMSTIVDLGTIEADLIDCWRKALCSSCQAEAPFEIPPVDLLGWEIVLVGADEFGLLLCPKCQTSPCFQCQVPVCVQPLLPPANLDSSG